MKYAVRRMWLWALMVLLVLGGAQRAARAELLVYDGFDYSTGDLSGNEGGSGFDGAWNQNAADVLDGSLTYGNLVTTGNRISNVDLGRAEIRRALDGTWGKPGETIWFAYLMKPVDLNGGVTNWGGLQFPPAKLWFGNNADDGAGHKWGLEDPRPTNSNVDIVEGETHLVIQLIEFTDNGDGKTRAEKWMWVDPDPASLGQATLDKNTAIIGNAAGGIVVVKASTEFSNVYGDFDSDFECEFDEMRIGASFADVAPTPPAAAPIVSPGGGVYETGPVEVTLVNNEPGATVYYTTDGTEPNATSTAYTAPFNVTQSATVKAVAIVGGKSPSPVVSKHFSIGEILFYEPFDYAVDSLVEESDKWVRSSNGTYDLSVKQNSLAAPAGVNLKTPAGHKGGAGLPGTPGGGWNAIKRLRADLGQSISGGKVYVSMLVYHQNDGEAGVATGYQGIDLSAADNRPAQRSIWMGKASADNDRHYLEVVNNGGNVGNGADRQAYENWTAGTRFVVYVYDGAGTPDDPTDDTLTMYVNPDCRGDEPTSPDSSVALDTAWWWDDATTQYATPVSVRYLFLEAGTSVDSDTATAIGDIAWDEIRVGSTWAAVTPTDVEGKVATPAIVPAGGQFDNAVEVSIATETEGAEIWYTTDGSVPEQNGPASTLYTEAFLQDATATLKARAFKADNIDSEIAEATFEVKAATPTFAPDAAGEYFVSLDVTLDTATGGAAIWYTTDGSDPVQGAPSQLYTGPIALGPDTTTTIRARAYKAPIDPSDIAEATYTVGTVAPVVFDPKSAPFKTSVDVTMTSATPGAAIRYTTDGSDPGETDPLYTGPVTIDETATVRARAFTEGLVSEMTSETYKKVVEIANIDLDNVSMTGRLGDRHQKNNDFLVYLHDQTQPWRMHPDGGVDPRIGVEWMLNPYENRGDDRLRPWEGEYGGKWADAASLMVGNTDHAGLAAKLEAFMTRLRATQPADGYMGIDIPSERFGAWDLWNQWYALTALNSHKMFQDNAASLTTSTDAGEYIVLNYKPVGSHGITGGGWRNQPDTLDQLIRLYRLNGDDRLLDIGAHISSAFGPFDYMRTNRTLYVNRSHAYVVNAYLGAIVMYYRSAGDAASMTELGWAEAVWKDEVANHLFHTYSMGQGETFNADPATYSLGANKQETCATVEWQLHTNRLYEATGDVTYAHHLENTVYNALLAAQSVDGMQWMYHTKMNAAGKAWFSGATYCCYFSGPRGVARMPMYLYRTESDALRVDFYEPNTATATVDGVEVGLAMTTDYPDGGVVNLTVSPAQATDFSLKLRLPEWAYNVELQVNGITADVPLTPGKYAAVQRTWQAGDTVRLRFDMTARLIRRPAMTGIVGAAIQRGPEVLSLDSRDNAGLDLSTVSFYENPIVLPGGVSADGRRLYTCQAEVDGSPQEVVLTPYADCGNDGATYVTVAPVSTAASPGPMLGDFNNDGALNGLDIPGFKQALSIGRNAYYDQTGLDADLIGDFNGDGAFNGLDIPGFKAGLAGN